MSLIGMSKETYLKILDEVGEICYLMALPGKPNSWSAIEKILMERHNLSGDEVKTFTKLGGSKFDFGLSDDGLTWIADRPEPKLEDYPKVAEYLERG